MEVLTRHSDEPGRGLQTNKIQTTVPGHNELRHGRVLQRNEILEILYSCRD